MLWFDYWENGIRPQPRKLMAVHVWPQLQNSTDVKSFVGLCGFYQRFVADYATVATPLTNLMGKKTEICFLVKIINFQYIHHKLKKII